MSKYSDETKAAVMAALLTGQSVSSVAREYSIPRGTVAGWSSRLNSSDLSNVSNTKKAEIGDLLTDYLRETIITLKEQAVFFRDPTWLEKQGASELAVLHGVQTDKAIRLLEAFGDDSDTEA